MSEPLNDEAMRMLADLQAARDEPLHPDLVPYVTEAGGLGMPMIAHPLVHQILPINGMVNVQYAHKRAALAAAVEAGNLHQCVFLHARPYRTDALIDHAVGRDEFEVPLPLADATREVQELAGDVWTDSENLHQSIEDWEAMFTGAEGVVMGDADDRAAFADLPEQVTVYRGGCEQTGWSWSTNPQTAAWFANRFDAGHPLSVGVVAKSDVLAYLIGRGESEVVVEPGKVTNIRPYVMEGSD